MVDSNAQTNRREQERVKLSVQHPVLWKMVRTILIYVISFCIVIGTVGIAVSSLYGYLFEPVDPNDKETVEIVIPKGESVSSIARILEENHLIRNRQVFKLIVDFFDKGGKLKAGQYNLSKSMTTSEIIDQLSQGDGRADVMKIVIPEGMTVEQIANSLVKQGALKDTNKFLELCKTGENFMDYSFISDLEKLEDQERRYVLEGYLFPDTYQIFKDASEEQIIRKMMDRFSDIYEEKYHERADELGMTQDQVIILASIIEKEGKPKDFKKISAVFHNRLKEKMLLGSCVTLQYALRTNRLVLTDKDTSDDSPYNTYKRPGLPIGAVCNPGKQAIEAALYPDEEFMKEGYLYFALTDPATGDLAFSKTKKEHDKVVAKYRPIWKEYDEKQKEKQ
ncbi:MAG: endolytic transglycosylase MltG [Clostridia bacterium]|jgi:UPF0755 protein